jgi:hypothetical protein
MMSNSPTKLHQLSVTILGPEMEHRDSLREMLEGAVGQISWIPNSHVFRLSQGIAPRSKLLRLIDLFRGTSDPQYLDYLTKSLDHSDTKVVIAFWGTIPLPDLKAIKRARPHIKLILMTLCYPLTVTTLGIYRQHFIMRKAARFLDGILYPDEEMAIYFRERVFGKDPPPSKIIPPCWPASFQLQTPQPVLAPNPNLIYIGRTDLSDPTINPGDDIRPLMREIMESGVELHHGYSPETDDGHPRRKPFRYVSLQGLLEMMGNHDASLVCYNDQACRRDDRYRTVVPDRAITSVTAGIPIAIPSRGYPATKSYLKHYPAVIEFDSGKHLAEILSDRPRIESLRKAAWNARSHYTASRFGPELQSFIEQIL